MSTAVANKVESNVVTIRDRLEQVQGKLAEVLPPSLPPAKFIRLTMAAVNRTPKLGECTAESLLIAKYVQGLVA